MILFLIKVYSFFLLLLLLHYQSKLLLQSQLLLQQFNSQYNLIPLVRLRTFYSPSIFVTILKLLQIPLIVLPYITLTQLAANYYPIQTTSQVVQLVLFVLVRVLDSVVSNLYADYYTNATLLSNSLMLLILLYATFNL